MIQVVNNKGYEWTQHKGVFFKGYFFLDQEEKVYHKEEACEAILKCFNYEDFISFLRRINGCWSIIVNRGEKVWMAVDIARSMPLYFSDKGDVSDSAECLRKHLGIAQQDVDKDNIVELYASYYLFGNKTTYGRIKQLGLGEACEITGNSANISHYFYHINNITGGDITSLRKRIEEASCNTFKRLKAVINNRPVVLSMSGGYDSRFVGCMLKKAGIENVSCYTYGKPTSFEVIQSKKNAEALGFRWTCVEMTDEIVSRNLDEIGQSYFDYYNGHDFTAYMQNFVAVRKLQEDGWFKPNSVFLTGLCGDMPTGCYIEKYEPGFNYNISSATEMVYKMVFDRFELEDTHKERWIAEMAGTIRELPIDVKDYQSWQQAVDCIYTGTCHVHWYMHMNRPHDFFGYEWLLPYWDKEILMAWYSLPSDLKYRQKFYEEWLMDEVCKPYGLSQKKNLEGYSNKPIKRKLQYAVGGAICYLLLHLSVPFKRPLDISNFAPLELELYKRIRTKGCINYRRSGMMQLLSQYLIENRYGIENLKYVCKHTRSKE